MTHEHQQFKAGYVAIIGEPNVGKSTLLNALLKQRLSIVTKKPQTTRHRILGILSITNAQIIFWDTPGLLEPHYLLHKKMMTAAESAIFDADVILLIVEPNNIKFLDSEIFSRIIPKLRQFLVLIINKCDTIDIGKKQSIIEIAKEKKYFKEILTVSALNNWGIEDITRTIVKLLPMQEPLYPEDYISEHPERFFAAEYIRESIFETFYDEIPYSTSVDIRQFKEREHGKTYIAADIIVEKDSQKRIVIGKRGVALKGIGETSRSKIEEFLGKPVYLDLFVKVVPNWRRSEQWLKRLGYSSTQERKNN